MHTTSPITKILREHEETINRLNARLRHEERCNRLLYQLIRDLAKEVQPLIELKDSLKNAFDVQEESEWGTTGIYSDE